MNNEPITYKSTNKPTTSSVGPPTGSHTIDKGVNNHHCSEWKVTFLVNVQLMNGEHYGSRKTWKVIDHFNKYLENVKKKKVKSSLKIISLVCPMRVYKVV